MAWVLLGFGPGRGLRLGGRRFRACHSWLVVGRLVVPVGWCRLSLVLGYFLRLSLGL